MPAQIAVFLVILFVMFLVMLFAVFFITVFVLFIVNRLLFLFVSFRLNPIAVIFYKFYKGFDGFFFGDVFYEA